MYKIMKISKILTVAVVALGATVALSGCIRETFPKEGAITKDQLMGGQMDIVAENLLKGIPSGILSPTPYFWEHTDFGYPSIPVYTDQAAKLVVTSGWMMNGSPAYNRFMHAPWGKGYGSNGWMSTHFWYSYYPNIKSCNDVIALTEGNDDLASYSAIARVYRANMYLDLARLFEAMPVYAEDLGNSSAYDDLCFKVQGLTVPIVSENTAEKDAKANPRVSREEMFTFIFDDLKFAEEAFATYTPVNATDPSLAVIYGLYARAYMWLGGFEDGLNGELPEGAAAYAKAAEYAQKAIAAHNGSITTEAEWCDIINGFNSKVSSWMWTLYQSTDTIASNLHQFPAHMCPEADYGYCQFTSPGISSAAYERLSDTDFRKNLIKGPEKQYADFKPYTQLDEKTFNGFAPYTFFKFRPGQGSRTDSMVGGAIAIPMMRIEEMYFIEMEALLLSGDVAGADAKLYAFMANRDSDYKMTTNDHLDEILFQKGIEFWGEGLIMYDMKRLNIGVDCTKSVNYDPQARFKSTGRLPWWTACVPLSETQVNLAIPVEKNNPDPTDIYMAIQ